MIDSVFLCKFSLYNIAVKPRRDDNFQIPTEIG